jgi:hypothetical protein
VKFNISSAIEEADMPARKWSQEVTDHSNALDLDEGVFALDDPAEITRSLKRSAERSHRRKGTSFQSAMSMLPFYINRAGKSLAPKGSTPARSREGRTAQRLWARGLNSRAAIPPVRRIAPFSLELHDPGSVLERFGTI